MKRIGAYHVRIGDGTVWSVDAPGDKNLNRILRYGTESEVLEHRLTIASLLSSYEALLGETQKRRNEIASQIREARAMPSPGPAEKGASDK